MENNKMTREQRMEAMAAEAMEKFNKGPLMQEALTAGWAAPLTAYALAMARFQAHLITKTHPNEWLEGFDADSIFGEGFTEKLNRQLPCAQYQFTQWQREMKRECCHGAIVIRVPQDHYRRLIAEGCALQNAAAASAGDV